MAHKPDEAALVPSPPASQYDQAKALFLQHVSPVDISRITGATMRQISRWRVEDQWVTEREAADRSLIEDGFDARRVTISKLATMSLEQVKRAIEHVSKRIEPPSVQEAERLTTIAANLDKIGRLDTGRATENLAIQGSVRMTVDEIKKIVNSDPFGTPAEEPHAEDAASGS